MANEISYTFQLLLNNGELGDSYSSTSNASDQTNPRLIRATQNIGTSAEALSLGDVAAPGWSVFKNLDDTNFVEIGIDSGGFLVFLKLEPGEQCMTKLGTTAPYAKADTAAVELFYIIYDS